MKFWRTSTVGSIAVAVALILWAVIRVPDFIDQKTQEFFKEKFVGSALTNTVETVISNRAAALVDYRLAPLASRTDDLSNRVEETRARLDSTARKIRESLNPMQAISP